VTIVESPLQITLREIVDSVGPFARGYPVYLEAPAGAETIAARELMRPEPMRDLAGRALREWTDRPLDQDPRAAVSRMIRRYTGSLVTAALAPLAHGIGLDTSPERVRVIVFKDLPRGIVLTVDEVLVSADRPATRPVVGRDAGSLDELRRRVYEKLFAHCAWAFDRVIANIKVSPQLLWSTVAEQVDLLYENAIDGPDAAVFARTTSDRDLALDGERLPGVAGPNPMKDLLFWEPSSEDGHRIEVRRVCCANFVVPGRPDVYCRNCGLITPAERLVKWSDWRKSVQRGSWVS
jgi:ferric iron reductase protein FhuF